MFLPLFNGLRSCLNGEQMKALRKRIMQILNGVTMSKARPVRSCYRSVNCLDVILIRGESYLQKRHAAPIVASVDRTCVDQL
jgi:hypothetical protein